MIGFHTPIRVPWCDCHARASDQASWHMKQKALQRPLSDDSLRIVARRAARRD
jgi:hypothetical protein